MIEITINPNKNYTVAEIADMTGKTVQTVYKWTEKGVLDTVEGEPEQSVNGVNLKHFLQAKGFKIISPNQQIIQPTRGLPYPSGPVNQWPVPQIDLEPVKESIEEIKDYALMLQKSTENLPDAIKAIFNIEGILDDKNLDDMDTEPTYFDKMAEDSESKKRREELEQKEQEIERREANIRAEFDKISRDKKRYEEKHRKRLKIS